MVKISGFKVPEFKI